MAPQALPCRLYVILARKAPLGVIFRRGPSKRVQVIKWDTANDIFERGQWLKGRIYERRCDLSPNGRLMVYFATKYSHRRPVDESGWTAVSKPPYLTALTLWFKGDTWFGGGVFDSDNELVLNDGRMNLKQGPQVAGSPLTIEYLSRRYRMFEEHMEVSRLLRDGWIMRQDLVGSWNEDLVGSWDEEGHSGYTTESPRILDRESQKLRLVRTDWLSGYKRSFRFEIRTDSGNIHLDLEGANWADWDHAGRLVFTREGKLFAAVRDSAGAIPVSELADLNPNVFTEIEAPAWAKEW